MASMLIGVKFLYGDYVCTVMYQVEILIAGKFPAKYKKVDNYRISGHPQYKYANSKQIRQGGKAYNAKRNVSLTPVA